MTTIWRAGDGEFPSTRNCLRRSDAARSHRTPPPGIDVHPPARCGDIAAAAAAGAAAIGLIDGVSEHGRSVWRKES
ncbi:hypothetical protein [Sphingomonas sp.]|uniref:hypothetical protein n=1 Tax=Sphingomonas sp. TaxID=28214 RepID=UPI0035BBBEC1